MSGSVDISEINEEIQMIQNKIIQKNADWVAGKTTVSHLSEYEKNMLLGLNVPKDYDEIEEDQEDIKISVDLPNNWDWRNVDGKNYMTPVKNQGNCGSCWAFGAVGAAEAVMKIEADRPDWDLELSEQDLVSCSGAGTCGGGRPDDAFEYMKKKGIVDEGCFPYEARDVSCSQKCDDWASRVTKAKSHGSVSNGVNAVKQALIERGPLAVGVGTSSDLFYYTGGNYTTVLDNSNDGPTHCVVLVGYSDSSGGGGQWILKNSWGTGWGNGGYYTLQYNSNFVESYAWWIDVGLQPDSSKKIDLIYPNGGESYFGGEIIDINWISENLTGNVKISYSTDSGETYPNEIATIPILDNSYSWTLPAIESENVKVKLEAIDSGIHTNPSDESDSSFSILNYFTDINAPIDKLTYSSIDWADIDNDADMDFAISGFDGSSGKTSLYRNKGNDVFEEISSDLIGLYNCNIKFADLNSDNYVDLIISGNTGESSKTVIYENNEGDSFSEVNSDLIGVYNSFASVADFNDDNLPDIVIAGDTGEEYTSKLYQNIGDFSFVETDVSLIDVAFCSIACADYDNDGLIYIAISGYDGDLRDGSTNLAKLFKNNGGFSFTDTNIDIPAVCKGHLIWDDFDNDQDLDLTISGFCANANLQDDDDDDDDDDQEPGLIQKIIDFILRLLGLKEKQNTNQEDTENDIANAETKRLSKILRNNGDGSFNNIDSDIEGLSQSTIKWANYDIDYYKDLFVGGFNGDKAVVKIYQKNIHNMLDCIISMDFSFDICSFSWEDYDNDGDIDLLLSGFDQAEDDEDDSRCFVKTNKFLSLIRLLGSRLKNNQEKDRNSQLITSNQGEIVTKIYRNNYIQ
jgi:C1A family cysteine protease